MSSSTVLFLPGGGSAVTLSHDEQPWMAILFGMFIAGIGARALWLAFRGSGEFDIRGFGEPITRDQPGLFWFAAVFFAVMFVMGLGIVCVGIYRAIAWARR